MTEESQKCSYCKETKLLENFSLNIQGQYFKTCNQCKQKHKCQVCEYTCPCSSDLNRHIKVNHLKIKDKKCPVCTYTCSTSGDLTKHIKTCTGKEHMSFGEFKVKKVLESLNIPFDKEVSEIKTEKSWLRFDFKITVDNCTKYIEFDGEQHFKPVCFGSMSPEKAKQNFEKTKLHDKLKNEWCKENNYELLRINYKDVNNVESLIKEFTTCSIN